MNIVTRAPRHVKDTQAHWVTRLLTLLPGSLGTLTVSSTIAVTYVLCSSEVYATPLDLKYGKSSLCD